jgi:flagellar biosynthesis protein FlhG
VLLDLGAGTSFNTLDFFNYSGGKITCLTSQAPSLQNAYGFIKSAFYRKLSRDFAKDDEILQLLYQGSEAGNEAGNHSIQDLLSFLEQTSPEKYARLAQALSDFQLFLVVNMVKTISDLQSPEIISSVCRDFLSIQPEILGQVPFDTGVEAAISRMVPFPLHLKKSKAMAGLDQIALRIVKESRLPRVAKGGSRVILEEEEDLPLDAIVTQPSSP